MRTNNRDENVKIAKELVGLAKELISYDKDSITMSMTREDMLNFFTLRLNKLKLLSSCLMLKK